MKSERSFTERVYREVCRLRAGTIASYGGVAARLGTPGAARGVGRALCTLAEAPSTRDVPWWRVVNRHGEVSTRCADHGALLQRRLLEGDGVRFGPGGRIDWEQFGAYAVKDPEPPVAPGPLQSYTPDL